MNPKPLVVKVLIVPVVGAISSPIVVVRYGLLFYQSINSSTPRSSCAKRREDVASSGIIRRSSDSASALVVLSGALGACLLCREALLVCRPARAVDRLFRLRVHIASITMGFCVFGSRPVGQQRSYDRMNLRNRDR